MNRELLRTISDEEIERYDTDGVVMLKNMFDADWIALLDKGLENSRNDPTARARVWDRDDAGRTVFYDSQAWQRVPEYERFIFESPCAEIAGRLMSSARVNFFFDAVFCRSPGTQFSTPWHQDEPYWSVKGFDTCSIWMPLVPVAAKSALAVVPGSHRWAEVFRQHDFGAFNPDEEQDINHSDFSGLDVALLPDIDGDLARYQPRSFDMMPGDCLVFNGRAIHGGSGQLPEGRQLKVFNTKWCGDDVRVDFRPWGMDPDHSEVMTEMGLKPGDHLGSALYPTVWQR